MSEKIFLLFFYSFDILNLISLFAGICRSGQWVGSLVEIIL